MNAINEHRRDSFGSVAELYDEVRPGYPRKLVEDVCSFARITEASHLLEIGAGTGKATKLFCTTGASLVAVEPSPEMAEILERNCTGIERLDVVRKKFEDVQFESDFFDLVFAAL